MNRNLLSPAAACVAVLLWARSARAERLTEPLTELRADIERIHQLDRVLAEVDEESERRLAEHDPNAATLRRRRGELLVRGARLKQAAIARAIEAYEIDVSRLPAGVSYSPHGDMHDREGATYLDAHGTIRVEIGDEAFASAALLGSTIAHEVEIHVNRQLARGAYYPPSDEQGMLLQEVEAYDHELANAARFGLAREEIRLLRVRRASYYRKLQWENRNRVDTASYVKW